MFHPLFARLPGLQVGESPKSRQGQFVRIPYQFRKDPKGGSVTNDIGMIESPRISRMVVDQKPKPIPILLNSWIIIVLRVSFRFTSHAFLVKLRF